ncbi:hypothetical protein CRUP_031887, partial [Coryphaenoides rupestris]
MGLLEKDGADTELLIYTMTVLNKGMKALALRHLSAKATDLRLVEQFNIYETTLRAEDGDDEGPAAVIGRKERRRASVGVASELRGVERRRSRRHSLQRGRGHASSGPAGPHTGCLHLGRRVQDVSERFKAAEWAEQHPRAPIRGRTEITLCLTSTPP